MRSHVPEDILEAFNRLIAARDFSAITVESIAREAGIGKTTFYRYFKDKYEVMNANYKVLLDRQLAIERCRDYRELFARLFQAARPGWKRLSRAFASTGVNSLSAFIASYSNAAALEITKRHRNGAGYTPAEELQMDVFCEGVAVMYRHWIHGKYSLDADAAAGALFAMLPDSLRYDLRDA